MRAAVIPVPIITANHDGVKCLSTLDRSCLREGNLQYSPTQCPQLHSRLLAILHIVVCKFDLSLAEW